MQSQGAEREDMYGYVRVCGGKWLRVCRILGSVHFLKNNFTKILFIDFREVGSV